MPAPTCRAIGCRAQILPEEVFCAPHTRLLQSDLRALLAKSYRPGRPPTKLFNEHLAMAQREILYAQTEGHRVPREADFEW